MFEQVIDKEKKHLGSLLKKDSKKVKLESVLNSNLSESYKKYFKAEVAWWIYQDRVIRDSGHYFEITDEITTVFDKLDGLYLKNAAFAKPVLNKVIDSAVKVRLNMLCRPRTAMKWFVFRGEPTRTVKEISCRLEYLHDHLYLVEATKKWLAELGEADTYGVSSAEFEQVIADLDSGYFLEMGPGEFYDLLVPLFDFFIISEVNKIPIEALIIFSDDKSLGRLTKTLEKILFRDKVTSITKQELIDIITELFDIKDEKPRSAINTRNVKDFAGFEAPRNLGSPVETKKQEFVESKNNSNSNSELPISQKDAMKHEKAGTEAVAKDVINELDHEEHDLDALADLVLQDESMFSQGYERKEYKAISDDDLEVDDDFDDILSTLESTIGDAEIDIEVDNSELEKKSDIQNEFSDLLSELDSFDDVEDEKLDDTGNTSEFAQTIDSEDEAVEDTYSKQSEISDHNINSELSELEDDPDWEEVAATYQSEDHHDDEIYTPPAEEGLSEGTIEEMQGMDKFLVSHAEDFASEKPYIEAENIDTDILLEELEGKHLISIKNDEEEEEIL